MMVVRSGILFVALALGLAAGPALADVAAADKCAKGLDSNGKKVYAAAKPHIKPGVSIGSVVTEETKRLVFSGEISRAAAKPAAEQAGMCLALINR